MTDRHMGYVVHLAENIREDDAQNVINAIRMISGVTDVTPVTADLEADVIAASRRDRLWAEDLRAFLAQEQKKPSGARQKNDGGS